MIYFLITNSISAFPIKNRVRISEVVIDNEIIEVNEHINIKINICKEKMLKFEGEIHVYLSCAGLCDEILFKEPVNIPFGTVSDYSVNLKCRINEVEADWYQEKFTLKVVLFKKNIVNNLVKIDTYSLESIEIQSKFFEKNKLTISKFQPDDYWRTNKSFFDIKSCKINKIDVVISNLAVYNFDVMVKVFLIEKTSLGIPMVEGFGEVRKEIGREKDFVYSFDDEKTIPVTCELNDAEIDKRNIDLRAVLFAYIDGELLEVDSSSIQTVEIPRNTVDELIIIGPVIWIIFVAGLGTLILVFTTIKIILPIIGRTGNEVNEVIEEVKKRKKKK